jgi:hypothetical protein
VTQYGTWVSYSGTAKIMLAFVLLAAAGGVTYAATRLRLPVRPARPGEAAATFMFVTWGLAIAAFAACATTVLKAARRAHVFHAPPVDPITPVTLSCVGVIFVIILLISVSSLGWGVALGSAALGALAAPMIFEFPFDLIVMARIYPPIPPHPALYRVLFFAPLFLIEVLTLSLLTLSPVVRLQGGLLFFRVDAGGFRGVGPVRIRVPLDPGPLHVERGVKDPGLRRDAQPFPPQRAQASTPGPETSPFDHGHVSRPHTQTHRQVNGTFGAEELRTGKC